MSTLFCFASDGPLPEVQNPHYRPLSVNEALALGEEVPGFLLDEGIDRDEPGLYLWTDITLRIDFETGLLMDEPEDDYAVRAVTCPELKTEKKHLAALDWGRCTAGKAENAARYLRTAAEAAGEAELWHLWLGQDDAVPEVTELPASRLTGEEIRALAARDPLIEHRQFCLRVTAEKR